ncbi:short-chain dehydrogenase/reductase SDR [Hysterangium stoloniferum]|nr:short-chain dehydrogenase/reductase SDR [Hysterangium stoloniferum]
MSTLEGKNVLIFGGSSGIGYAVAEGSLKSLASLVIIASSNAERVNSAVNSLEKGNLGPGRVCGEVIDAKDQSALKEFVSNIGEFDHIVWTSGDYFDVGFPNVELDVAKSAFDVRFWGPVLVAQHAKFRKGGSLTLTTGSALVKPRPGWSIVVGVAGAIDGLTRGLAVDLAPIRVNSICPGAVKTEMWDTIPAEQRSHLHKQTAGRTLLKRIGEPAEIAEAYLFVMKCEYITGQRIEVDGGYILGD